MKIKDLKHNHSLTDLLKVLIFSILMLAPMIAVGVKCAYVIVNKNANQSYSANKENIIEALNINVSNIETNKKYVFTNKTYTDTNSGFRTTNYNLSYLNIDGVEHTEYQFFRIYRGNDNNISLCLYYPNSTSINLELRSNQNHKVELIISNIINYNTSLFYDNYNVFDFYIYNDKSFLDNVFYYAIDEMSDNQLFSWTKNTGIYTGVKAMTDNLEITTDVIAVLITYWTLLTVIYVIIDIVLKGFTLLTHMFQKESH